MARKWKLSTGSWEGATRGLGGTWFSRALPPSLQLDFKQTEFSVLVCSSVETSLFFQTGKKQGSAAQLQQREQVKKNFHLPSPLQSHDLLVGALLPNAPRTRIHGGHRSLHLYVCPCWGGMERENQPGGGGKQGEVRRSGRRYCCGIAKSTSSRLRPREEDNKHPSSCVRAFSTESVDSDACVRG